MNSSVNDLRNCQICFNTFGSKESCPRVLSCGHTFCHSCLQRFISEGSVCPTCKEEFSFISADDIPINFSVKSFSETTCKNNDSPKDVRNSPEAATGSTNCKESLVEKKVTKNDELAYEGHCEKHFSPNHFKCIKCNIFICGSCVVLMHKGCSKVLPTLEALNLLKARKLKKLKTFKTKLEKEAKILDSKLDHLNRKQEKLNQEIENVETEVKETKSMKERNKKLNEESRCHEENLEKATCNEDYEKADAKVKFFFEENSVNISLLSSLCLSLFIAVIITAILSVLIVDAKVKPFFKELPPSFLSTEDAMKSTRKDLEENTFYVTKSDNEAMKYSKVKVKDDQISFAEWKEEAEEGSSCVDLLDFISSRTSVIDTHIFIEERKKELHNPKLPKERIKFSKIEVKEKGVYFHSFKISKESDFVLEFKSLLKTLGCSSVLPAEAFLKYQISSGEGQVVITTDGGSPRAINFLLLASGILNDSYQETKIYVNDSHIQGGYKRKRTLFPSVVEGIQDGGIYERKERKRGDVEGNNADQTNKLSYFAVRKKDFSVPSPSTFGRVRRGMEVVDQTKFGESVKECGLLFDLP